MSGRGRYDDASTVLYLVPFFLSGVYAMYLWAASGPSLVLPGTVYLTVTRDPVVFVLGTLAVFGGLLLDLRGKDPAHRAAALSAQSSFLQKMAAASFTLALAMALYSNGFLDLTGAAVDFVVGRFGVVFPAILVLLSYLITAPLGLGSLKSSFALGMIALLLVPAVVYELGRRNAIAGLTGAALLIIAGVLLFLRSASKAKKTGEG